MCTSGTEGKKCCVSRAYAVCWVTPNFWEDALTAEKRTSGTLMYSKVTPAHIAIGAVIAKGGQIHAINIALDPLCV